MAKLRSNVATGKWPFSSAEAGGAAAAALLGVWQSALAGGLQRNASQGLSEIFTIFIQQSRWIQNARELRH